jgi:hypothetical protein
MCSLTKISRHQLHVAFYRFPHNLSTPSTRSVHDWAWTHAVNMHVINETASPDHRVSLSLRDMDSSDNLCHAGPTGGSGRGISDEIRFFSDTLLVTP